MTRSGKSTESTLLTGLIAAAGITLAGSLAPVITQTLEDTVAHLTQIQNHTRQYAIGSVNSEGLGDRDTVAFEERGIPVRQDGARLDTKYINDSTILYVNGRPELKVPGHHEAYELVKPW